MENTSQVNFIELTEDITKASQKIIKNYLDNKSGYEHDHKDIERAYTQFRTPVGARLCLMTNNKHSPVERSF